MLKLSLTVSHEDAVREYMLSGTRAGGKVHLLYAGRRLYTLLYIPGRVPQGYSPGLPNPGLKTVLRLLNPGLKTVPGG